MLEQDAWMVGNRHIWNQIRDHVRPRVHATTLSFTSCIFVLGATGIGKTYHIQRILEPYEIYPIHASNCLNYKELRDMLRKASNPSLITRTHSEKPFVIVIDDIDILCSLDRMMMTTLLDIFINKEGLPHVPILCIGNLELEKRLGNTRNKCTILRCTAPTDTDIFLFLKAHPLAAKKTKKSLMKIAEDCEGNLHRALEQLRMIASHPKKQPTPVVKKVPKTPSYVQKLHQEMMEDPWMMPLRYHENVPKYLKGTTADKKLAIYNEVMTYFGIWDHMMNHSEMDQELAIDVLSHALNIYTKPMDSLDDFTKLLSNLSLQKKNERLTYPNWNHGFPWSHTQIFCEYSKQKWTTSKQM